MKTTINSIAHMMAALSASATGTKFHYTWKSSASKNPRHLRFGAERTGEIAYMRDGILTTTNQCSGTYNRIREFSGPNQDEHEVILNIKGPVFDGETELTAQ